MKPYVIAAVAGVAIASMAAIGTFAAEDLTGQAGEETVVALQTETATPGGTETPTDATPTPEATETPTSRRRSGASTRRSPPTSACWRSRRATARRAQALDRLYTQGRALGRSDALPRGRCSSAACCPSASWSASASAWRRSSTIASTIARAALEHLRAGAARRSRSPGRDRHARGDARRHRRAGRGRRAARAGVRGPRRLAGADQDRRDPPAAGRGARASASPGPSASRASTRSSSRTTTARCAGTARSSRRRRPSA